MVVSNINLNEGPRPVTSSPVPGVRVEPSVLRAATLVQLLAQVPDPRKRRGRRHRLVVVLALAVGAVAAGARSLTSIGEWAHDVGADLLTHIGLTGSVPSEATIRRVIEALDAGVFSLLCGAWTRLRWRQVDGQTVIAVDGKTIRGARDVGTSAPHLVAALTHDTGLVLGQVAVDAKSNEIPALRDLLGLMDIRGLVITADALHTQRDTATFILNQGGDYLFTVKGNQPGLYRRLAALPWPDVPAQRSTEHSHGRTATRTIRAVEAPDQVGFPGTAQVLQLRRTVTRHGKRSVEVVYLICSKSMIQAPPATVAGWVRGHWGIEDRLHYVRDWTFDEDRCRVRTGSGAEVMAALRNFAISLLRLAGWDNIAQATRHIARDVTRAAKLILTT